MLKEVSVNNMMIGSLFPGVVGRMAGGVQQLIITIHHHHYER